MNSRDEAFDQYAAIADQIGPPPRLPAPERMDAAAARLRRVTTLPAVRKLVHGPLLWNVQQLAAALELSAHRHRIDPADVCAAEVCMPAQIADALLGEPIAHVGHDPDGAGGETP